MDIDGQESLPNLPSGTDMDGHELNDDLTDSLTDEGEAEIQLEFDDDELEQQFENFPHEELLLKGTWQTEKGNPVSLCTEENVEPRLVVYGGRSWWTVRSREHQTPAADDKQRVDDTGQRAPVQEEIFLVLILLLAIVVSNFHCGGLQR